MRSNRSEDNEGVVQDVAADSCMMIKVRGQLNDEKREQLREILRAELMQAVAKIKVPLMVEIVG